jgi:exonuclease VII small subunit
MQHKGHHVPKAQSTARQVTPAKQKKASSSPLTSEERRVVSELRQLLAAKPSTGESKHLLWVYSVGTCLQTLERKRKNLEYGKGHLERITRSLESDPKLAATLITFLYQARKFAYLYSSEAEAKALARKKNAAGKPFTWSVLRNTFGVHDKAKQDSLIEYWAKNAFSVRDWQRAIAKKTRVRRSWGGRPPPRPTTVPDVILQVYEMSHNWGRWQEIILEKLKKGETGKTKTPLIEKLPKELRKLLSQAKTKIKQIEETTRTLLKVSDEPSERRKKIAMKETTNRHLDRGVSGGR